MKLSTKAACLSAFVFPGSGHLFLKCYLRGIIFIFIAGVGLFIFMQAAFAIAWEIANDIETGKVPLDVVAIQSLIHQAMTTYQKPELISAKYAIIGSWVISSADAWREGKRQNKQDRKLDA